MENIRMSFLHSLRSAAIAKTSIRRKRETVSPAPNHEQRYRYSRADGGGDPGVSDRGRGPVSSRRSDEAGEVSFDCIVGGSAPRWRRQQKSSEESATDKNKTPRTVGRIIARQIPLGIIPSVAWAEAIEWPISSIICCFIELTQHY